MKLEEKKVKAIMLIVVALLSTFMRFKKFSLFEITMLNEMIAKEGIYGIREIDKRISFLIYQKWCLRFNS